MKELFFLFILQASACSLYNNDEIVRDFRRNRKPKFTERTVFTTGTFGKRTSTMPSLENIEKGRELYKGPNKTLTDKEKAAKSMNARFLTTTSTTTRKPRTTLRRVSLDKDCHYLKFYCMRAYKTGVICGRTIYYNYHTFPNYCTLDFVNCMERYEAWQIMHMGECFKLTPLKVYDIYDYNDDSFLDRDFAFAD